MKEIIVLTLMLPFIMPVATMPAWAVTEQAEQGVTDVGNKLCPVMGGPVSGGDFVVYEGRRYGLCCPGCKASFLAEPEKYIAKMKEQEQTVPQSTSAAAEEHAQHHDMGM